MKYQVGDVVNAALFYYPEHKRTTLLTRYKTDDRFGGYQLDVGWVGDVKPLNKDVPEEQATALRQAYALARLAGQI